MKTDFIFRIFKKSEMTLFKYLVENLQCSRRKSSKRNKALGFSRFTLVFTEVPVSMIFGTWKNCVKSKIVLVEPVNRELPVSAGLYEQVTCK